MPNRRRPAELVCSIGLAIAGLGLMAVAAPPVSHDFNADGSNDYPVSVTGHDPIAPVNGAARMWSGASKSIIDTIIGDETNTLFGWSIGSAGDLDADGFDDLIVGEPLWGPNGTLQGRVRVFSGDDSSVLLTATGPYLETGLGRYVAGIGDWNGDGTPDIVSSGWDIADLDNDGIGDDAIGSVYVLSGVDGSVLAEIFEPTATALFGYSVFGLGDITGDGLADIAVVDRGAEGALGSGAIGRLYVFTGRTQTAQLSTTDAHRTILNSDATLRGFAAQVDTMHPDLWLDEATLQIISLTAGGTGGPNQAQTAIAIRKVDGQAVGDKGMRPTLVLAGDVNLDGKVNAQDLQESIAQLGTNPQATGVMPLADLNGDNIVDTHDVALLLQDYGDETDIYEGLWDGSRLLAVVGGSAGFGTIGGGAIGGNWGLEPGRRPVDDCLRDMPGNDGSSLAYALLRMDAQVNCNECSECGISDPLGCYKCSGPGRIEGGEITATPEQPMPGDTVIFDWDQFILTGRRDQCGPPCNGNRTCNLVDYVMQGGAWFIHRKDPATGQWIEPPYKSSNNPNDQPTVTDGACGEYKFTLVSGVVEPRYPCPGLPAVTREMEIQFSPFILRVECLAATPENKNRTNVGIRESFIIHSENENAEPTLVQWVKIDCSGTASAPTFSTFMFQNAPFLLADEECTLAYEVRAPNGSCLRRLKIKIVKPESVSFQRSPCRDVHLHGLASAGFGACVTILPTNVSFAGLYVGEGECYPTVANGNFAGTNDLHESWYEAVGENNRFDPLYDGIYFGYHEPSGGYMPSTHIWDVPWQYKASLTSEPQEFCIVRNIFQITDNLGTARTEKGGIVVTFGLMDNTINFTPSWEPYWPLVGCPPNTCPP